MYTIEKKYINTNSMTVAAAERYYGKNYRVTDIFWHWWGLPENRASSPDAIYNYMKNANKSVRHIVGWDDAKKKVRIIAMTPENRVPLTQQGGNIYGDSVEVDPLITTSDPRAYELYKALGWLKVEREKRWGRKLGDKLHKEVWATQCSNIDKARVEREAAKWRAGTYDPKKTTPAGAKIKYVLYDEPEVLITNKRTTIWDFNHTRHSDMESKGTIPAGEPVTLVGYALNESTGGSKYMMTSYSLGKDSKGKPVVNFTNGMNRADFDGPKPEPVVVVEPTPVVEEPKPEPVVVPIPVQEPEPVQEPVPVEVVEETPPTSEAAMSATKFLARIGTQLAAAKILVEGVLAALASYNVTLSISETWQGVLTIAVAAGIIFWAQFGYKIQARFKWFF